MPRAKRICPKPGCPRPVVKRYCEAHEREYEAKRGSSQQRGYDSAHRELRSRWAVQVQTGQVHCATCHEQIKPGDLWDLGHTEDRAAYVGPQHARCNRSEGGRRGRLYQSNG